ncbi:MAG: VCBS repeat-containing protein, partial [Candidatus Bathyarchaeota archaeon]
KSIEWCTDGSAAAKSVYVCDLDNNGDVEVITGGYDHGLTNSSGQLRIWQWDGKELLLKANEEWRLVEGVYGVTVTGDPMGNTLVENIKVGDVDGDGVAEILTGGFAYDGQQMNAQLRIWNWDGTILVLEESHEWFIEDITEIKAIALDDVNGDGKMEILASGGAAVYGGFDVDSEPEAAFLTVWSWDGDILRLKNEEDWTIGEGVFAWNVDTGDVDGDGKTEIVTVGCMYINQLCDPDLRIWSLQGSSDSSTSNTFLVVAVVGTATAVSVVIVAYLFVRRKRNEVTSK